MKDSLLIVGSVAYDCIETPLDSADFILGGSASYAALAASFFSSVKIVGVVGNDFKESDISRLAARSIDISAVITAHHLSRMVIGHDVDYVAIWKILNL